MKTVLAKKEWTIKVYASHDVPTVRGRDSGPFRPIKLVLTERTSKLGTKIAKIEAFGMNYRRGVTAFPPTAQFRLQGYDQYPECPEWIVKAFRSAGWRGKVEPLGEVVES